MNNTTRIVATQQPLEPLDMVTDFSKSMVKFELIVAYWRPIDRKVSVGVGDSGSVECYSGILVDSCVQT